jgi:hypothetical protein
VVVARLVVVEVAGLVVTEAGLLVVLTAVVAAPVDEGRVLLTGGVLPQPTRLELMATSSYQKVLVSPPYDSQPKYTPVSLGL